MPFVLKGRALRRFDFFFSERLRAVESAIYVERGFKVRASN